MSNPAQSMKLRPMRPDEMDIVAALICDSTNHYYLHKLKAPPIFPHGPASTRLFPEVYEALDPGCCVVAEDVASGRIMGSCFYHPRPTHVSLGIMNAHPDFFSRGVARALLDFVIAFAERENKPVRLVSSAANLDSFSLYTRAGFVPRCAFQDVFIQVPADGFTPAPPGRERVRPVRPDDAPAMAALEMELSHISREKDFRYFIDNALGIWHVSVLENPAGVMDGFLASVNHPASNMLGPGVARTQEDALALIAAELDHHRGRKPVFLVPVECNRLVAALYGWRARNCEIHFAQVRGRFEGFTGVGMPTFMPETG